MVKIVSFEPPTDKQLKQSPLESLEDWFNSLDKFTKVFFMTILVLLIITPFYAYEQHLLKTNASELNASNNITGIPISPPSTPSASIVLTPTLGPISSPTPTPTPTQTSGNISFVKTVGLSTQSKSGNNSITIPVQSPGVKAGSRVIIAVQAGTFQGTVGCKDSKGNSYSLDGRSLTNNIFICSGKINSALTQGDTITATYPGFSGISTISANEFSGINAIDAPAKLGSSTSSTTVSTQILTTTKPNDLILGVVGSKNSFTPATGLSTASSFNGLATVYRVVGSPGTFSILGSVTTGSWNAIMVGYR